MRNKGVNVNNSRLSGKYDDSHCMDEDLHIESHFGKRGDRSAETQRNDTEVHCTHQLISLIRVRNDPSTVNPIGLLEIMAALLLTNALTDQAHNSLQLEDAIRSM